MLTFDFSAVDGAGRPINGRIEAPSREAAVDELAQRGQFVVSIGSSGTEASRAPPRTAADVRWWQRPRPADTTLLTRDLSLLLGGGLSLSAALTAIATEGSNQRIKTLAGRLRRSIAGGKSLAEALTAETPAFSPVYIGMVKAAEASGSLPSVLERLANTQERDARLHAKLVSALLYPSLLIITAIGTVLLLLLYVVPRIKDSLGDQVAHLPAASQSVFAVSDWVLAWGQLAGLLSAVSVLLLGVLWRRPATHRLWQSVLIRLPLIGTLARMALAARFCRTLGALLSSGLQLPAALVLTRDVIGHHEAAALIDKLGVALRSGEDFTRPLAQSPIFPGLVASMLRTGVEGGALPRSSERLADMYDAKVDIALQRLMTILEPTIILLISVFISGIVISVMSAIMGLYDLTGSQL